MTLQEAETRLSELNSEINGLLKERECVLKDWSAAFYAESPTNIVCIDENIGDYYKCIDMSMKMHNMANGRELDSPDYQKNLVYAKAAEIRENYMAKHGDIFPRSNLAVKQI